MQVKFFHTFVLSQHFLRKLRLFLLEKNSCFSMGVCNEIKKVEEKLFLNDVCKVIKLGLCLKIKSIQHNRLIFQASK